MKVKNLRNVFFDFSVEDIDFVVDLDDDDDDDDEIQKTQETPL